MIERYVALVGKLNDEILGNVRQAPLKQLRRYFENLVTLAGQTAPIPGCLLGSLSLEVAAASPLLQGHLRSSFTHWQTAIAAVLCEAVEKGELAEIHENRHTRKTSFSIAGEGALLRSQADKSDAPLKHFLHYVFEENAVEVEHRIAESPSTNLALSCQANTRSLVSQCNITI